MKRKTLLMVISFAILILFLGTAATCNFCGLPVTVGDEEATLTDSETSDSKDSNDTDTSDSNEIETDTSSSNSNNNTNDNNEQDQQVQETPGVENNDQQQDDLGQDDDHDQQQIEQEDEVEEQAILKEENIPLVGSETGHIGINLKTNEVGIFFNDAVAVGYQISFIVDQNNVVVPVHDLIDGFISFDISSLSGAQIQDVVLHLNNCIVKGDPSYFNKMYINIINWGSGPPPKSILNTEGTVVQGYPISSGGNIQCSNSVLKDGLQQAINNGSQRFQLRLLFSGTWQYKQSSDSEGDRWRYSKENIRLTARYLQ